MEHTAAPITPASITWKTDELGHTVPFSNTFNDIYFSLTDGLAESQYVFIEQNNLPQRFNALFKQSINKSSTGLVNTFTIAELGFGTGLNLLVTWQLWRQIKQQYLPAYPVKVNTPLTSPLTSPLLSARLHYITTEKHPLSVEDLIRSLACWQKEVPSLAALITQLIDNYPPLIAGCHRLHLADDVIVDLWLAEASQSLASLAAYNATKVSGVKGSGVKDSGLKDSSAKVDAWYLDGFAPTHNESLWASSLFKQMYRLSKPNTTVATYSCAGVVKRGLTHAGFTIKKVKGFGQKKHMLTAIRPCIANFQPSTNPSHHYIYSSIYLSRKRLPKVTVIGSGISGLMSAWSLAQRGIQVQLLDKSAPLAGASGNPRALLAPKMTPLAHVAEHLHSISYLYSSRFYRHLDKSCLEKSCLQQAYLETTNEAHATVVKNKQTNCPNSTVPNSTLNDANAIANPIFEATGTLDLLTKANVDTSHIAAYPDNMATTLPAAQAANLANIYQLDLQNNLYLPQAGLVNPQALAATVLAHPLITFTVCDVQSIKTSSIKTTVDIIAKNNNIIHSDAVVIAAAYDSPTLDDRIFDFRKIRGQLSWFTLSHELQAQLPKIPLKYGGYCATFVPTAQDISLNNVMAYQSTFLLGASFIRNDTDSRVRAYEHYINREKLIAAVAEFDKVIPDPTSSWQARVGIRAQTPDYHPVLGQVDGAGLIWTISGMGSKGYAFAPLCAEILADMMTGQFAPVSSALINKLSPQRARLAKVFA